MSGSQQTAFAVQEEVVIKDPNRFKRFLANNKAVFSTDCESIGDLRTTDELIDCRIAELTADTVTTAL
jgi:hypothetical protein